MKPIITIAVELKTQLDRDKMNVALTNLAQNDPTFNVHTDPDLDKTIISGMSELHLEKIIDCLKDECEVEFVISASEVVYLETIRANVQAEGRYIRQTGGSANYGHVMVRISPNEYGKGYEFSNNIGNEAFPANYITAIDQGVQNAMQGGILTGAEMVDIKVSLYDGSYHEIDSNEMAFKIAASMAFKEAARKAKPVLLEPVMDVEIKISEEYIGATIGDLNNRRGRIEGMEMVGTIQHIKAAVPLSTMLGYAAYLQSSTQGHADCSMQFKCYEAVPRSPGGHWSA